MIKMMGVWSSTEQEIDLEFDGVCNGWKSKHKPLNLDVPTKFRYVSKEWISDCLDGLHDVEVCNIF